ncbi:hypothetical protein HDU76_007405 [Blyttiomyces sp. JEL0837]|nr:hypothetical protein HDU76_007405 [Blyttiomyces sp. JEL0837]
MPPSIITTTLMSMALAMAFIPSLVDARTPSAFKPPHEIRQLIDIKHGQPVTSNDTSTLIGESTITGAKLQYYGGPLLANTQVFPIFYGSPLYKNELIAFYKAIVGSTYFDLFSEYNTATVKIGKGSYIGSYSEASQLVYIDDATVLQPYLRNLVKLGIIQPNNNTYYPVHFGPLINIVQGTDASCQAFCGFHGTIDISDISSTKYLNYGVIPDQTGLCMGGCGPSSDPKDNLFAVSSHELAESITNPAVSLATGYSYPLGWYDPTNGEVADICNTMQTNVIGTDGVTYRVQLLWSNSQSGCIGPTASLSTVTTTTKSTTMTTNVATGNTCHDVCVAGGPLVSTCGTCAALVLSKDTYCGTTAWDSSCIQEAKTFCGLTCEGAVPCDHDPCLMGTALKANCDTCVDKVLASDPYCGSTSWDAVCVSEAMTICGKKCLPRAAPGGVPKGPISIPTGYHTCTHNLCQLGAPLVASCDPCVALITSTDSFCGTTAWDLTCVMEALGCSTTNCRTNKVVVQTSARTSVKATSKPYIAPTTNKGTTTVKTTTSAKKTTNYQPKTTTSVKKTTTTARKTTTTVKKLTTTAKPTSKKTTSTAPKPKYTTKN